MISKQLASLSVRKDTNVSNSVMHSIINCILVMLIFLRFLYSKIKSESNRIIKVTFGYIITFRLFLVLIENTQTVYFWYKILNSMNLQNSKFVLDSSVIWIFLGFYTLEPNPPNLGGHNFISIRKFIIPELSLISKLKKPIPKKTYVPERDLNVNT